MAAKHLTRVARARIDEETYAALEKIAARDLSRTNDLSSVIRRALREFVQTQTVSEESA